ncbi:MAG: DUF2147 domain-containing protein [Desulfobacter sp.]|nr:DUF2147 domain-containing protein [Desulfobacter sp.]
MKTSFRLSILTSILTLFILSTAYAQASVVGKWKTIDDETNEPKSIVEIFEKDGKYYGKIVKLFLKPGDDQNPTCDKCKDDDPRKDKPTLGMVIMQDMVKKGEKYGDGTILDPKKGKVYKCKFWTEEGNLKLRGYIGVFFRTQTWLPAE